MIHVDIEFSVFLCEIVEKQDDGDKVMHKYDESVQIMILYDDAKQ